ncbi:cytochrome P450 [Halobellus captivus]|uniref:cytochrome P450 n=1 Tax=Halobellus captivus TaxID=2592614 RepID=UPI0011A1C8D4|nr:cytochrome P450 [Halobellus captivus]
MTDSRPSAPNGLPLLGNAVSFARDPLTFTTDAVADVGDVFRIELPVGDRYVVAHPTHATRVLVSERDAFEKTDDFALAFGTSVVAADGDDWREQREFLNPFFFGPQIRSMLPTMREQTVARATPWDDGDTIETLSEMQALTFDVLATTLLDFDPESNREDLRRAADDLNAYFDPVTWALPNWIPTPSRRRFDEAKATLRRELRALLADADGDARPDDSLVSALATMIRSDPGADSAGGAADQYAPDADSAIDQLIGLVFAGHETTALALTFTLHCLATTPDVYREVESEIDDVVGDDPVGWDHLDDLETLERAIDESLRLYPPVHALPRETTRSVEFDGSVIPAGSELLVSVFAMHRDERFWEHPETFDPARWRERDRSDDAYLPFGAGPRRCIGETFARVEARVALAELIRRYRFERPDGAELTLSPEMTNQPDDEVPMRIHRR